MAEEEKDSVVQVPIAKRHKLLLDIQSQLNSKEADDIFEVDGHKYFMTTLTADEEVWADGYCNMNSQISAYSSMRIPRLSASIKQIDGEKVEALFDFSDDTDKAEKEFHSSSQIRKRFWIMNQMMLMLGDMPGKFIVELWTKYSELTERRDKGWDELKKSLARTPGGKSKDTSLPEKGSSQVTQTLHV
jgi:hypothetical protein